MASFRLRGHDGFRKRQMTDYINLDRKFWPVEADKEHDPETIRVMAAIGVDRQISWEELLKRPCVIILGEPGSGKTEELRAITRRLRETGVFAFFCRIEFLQELDVRQALDIGTSIEFDEWITGDKEAYFFLDSVDEARLSSRKAFEKALRLFVDALGGSLNRASLIVSCRVSEWRATADLELLKRYLPELKIAVRKKNAEAPVRKAGKAAEEAQMESVEERDHSVFQLVPNCIS